MSDKKRIVICASEADDTLFLNQEKGWVTSFARYLELMIFSASGEQYAIEWLYESSEVTEKNFKDKPILLIVLSPDFLYSDKLMGFFDLYTKATGFAGDELIQHVFKVVKSPFEEVELPEVLEQCISYEFFTYDEDTGDPREIVDFFSVEGEQYFWMRLVDLAYDIHEIISMDKGASGEERGPGKSIYLAETGNDLAVHRNIIKRELQRHGYHVLPNKRLPSTPENLEKAIRDDLTRCELSIHLIGDLQGRRIPMASEAVPMIQNRICGDYGIEAEEKGELFRRLVWVSSNIREGNDIQVNMIEEIKRDADGIRHTEVLQSPLEDFKTAIWVALGQNDAPVNEAEKPAGEGSVVYLIHDKADQALAVKVAAHLAEAGMEVRQPALSEDLMTFRKSHIQNLIEFDYAIILQDKINNYWVRMKYLDLLKSPGFGRKKEILGKLILTTNKQLRDESFYEGVKADVRIINKSGSPELLEQYFATKTTVE